MIRLKLVLFLFCSTGFIFSSDFSSTSSTLSSEKGPVNPLESSVRSGSTSNRALFGSVLKVFCPVVSAAEKAEAKKAAAEKAEAERRKQIQASQKAWNDYEEQRAARRRNHGKPTKPTSWCCFGSSAKD